MQAVTTAPLRPVELRPDSLTEIAFERIREAIVSRSLAPGARVSESMLAGMLHVSKTPVREALLRLCHIGLVEPSRSGLRVVMPNREIIQEVYELRSGLEPDGAMRASLRADRGQRKQIAEAAQLSLERAERRDSRGFAEWDTKFHLAVAAATGNKMEAKAIENAVILAFALRSRDVITIDDSAKCGADHVHIARAIADGAADEAKQMMYTHIIEAMDLVLALDQGASPFVATKGAT